VIESLGMKMQLQSFMFKRSRTVFYCNWSHEPVVLVLTITYGRMTYSNGFLACRVIFFWDRKHLDFFFFVK